MALLQKKKKKSYAGLTYRLCIRNILGQTKSVSLASERIFFLSHEFFNITNLIKIWTFYLVTQRYGVKIRYNLFQILCIWLSHSPLFLSLVTSLPMYICWRMYLASQIYTSSMISCIRDIYRDYLARLTPYFSIFSSKHTYIWTYPTWKSDVTLLIIERDNV